MYVTLEPCAHQGRQPPCTEAILEAGIGRVVIASEDPSEKAAGRGPGILRDGGIEVEMAAGEEATAARLLNQPFRKHVRTGLPLVVLKLAMSLDGRTTTPEGDSPWISGERSRELVHGWRAESDAVAVGIGTVLADDPLLTARPIPSSAVPSLQMAGQRNSGAEVRQPLRVVFDRRARLPLDSQLLATLDQAPAIVVVSQQADPVRTAALRDAGAEILVAGSIEAALSELGRRDITSLFLEVGQTIASAFLAADAIDEVRTFVAPMLLGGAGRAGPVAGVGGLPRPTRCSGRRDVAHEDLEPRPPQPSGSGKPPTPAPPTRAVALFSEAETVGDDVLITARMKEW
jgi:diaminohydroxyphosphoribosylaminopyrimidine deaminase/5-amino-6-(5-phosphoribosylamino)uracil reductase